jgi:Predicted ATP-grasp enzyme
VPARASGRHYQSQRHVTQLVPPVPGAVILGGHYGSLAAIRSLGRKGVPVAFLGDPLSVAAVSRYVTHFVVWRGAAEPDPLSRLLDIGRRLGLSQWVLMPSADFETQLIASNAAALAAFFRVAAQDWSTLSQLHDKRLLSPLARSIGVGFPSVYPSDGDMRDAVLPVVIKPGITRRDNALTRAKAWRADRLDQLKTMQAEAHRLMGEDGFVIQQLIPGDGDVQYSYAGLWDNGRELRGMTALRLRQFPLHFGTSPFVVSTALPRAATEAGRLLAAVNYTGLIEIEFKHDRRDDQLKLLDANTRIWAWIGLGEAVGIDFPYLAALLACGAELPQAGPVHYGPAWRRSVPNLLSSLQSLLRNGHAGLEARRSIFGPAHSAVRAADDRRPAALEVPLQAARKIKGLFAR